MDTQYIHRVFLGKFNRSTKELVPFEVIVIESLQSTLEEIEFEAHVLRAYPALTSKELKSLVVLSSFVTCK